MGPIGKESVQHQTGWEPSLRTPANTSLKGFAQDVVFPTIGWEPNYHNPNGIFKVSEIFKEGSYQSRTPIPRAAMTRTRAPESSLWPARVLATAPPCPTRQVARSAPLISGQPARGDLPAVQPSQPPPVSHHLSPPWSEICQCSRRLGAVGAPRSRGSRGHQNPLHKLK